MNVSREPVRFQRDCEALAIPQGHHVLVTEGSEGVLMQVLGGNFTLMLDSGQMVRVAGKDAPAIGREIPPEASRPVPEGPVTEEAVMEVLRTVFDPEIPVNVVDLGLVYECRVLPAAPSGHRVEIRMTMTAPGCGMGDVLKAEAEGKVSGLPGVREVRVDLVWDPPWSQARMSEAARLQLGMYY